MSRKPRFCAALGLCAFIALYGAAARAGFARKELPTTAGSVLSNATVYTVSSDVTITAGATVSALKVADNATVVINIPEGVTLTVNGGNASGRNPAGAGIYLPSSSSLYIVGAGNLVAKGGVAGWGSDGSNGKMGWMTKEPDQGEAGAGGDGGAGGGGAGAGIGTCGGIGGSPGAAGKGIVLPCNPPVFAHDGFAGSSGGRGGNSPNCGFLYVLGRVAVSATGGSANGTGGLGGASTNAFTDAGRGWGWNNNYSAGAGGGGGGGGSGYAAPYGIGSGGAGGGGGGGGGSGATALRDTGYEPAFGCGGYGGVGFSDGVAGVAGGSTSGEWTCNYGDDRGIVYGGAAGPSGTAGSAGDYEDVLVDSMATVSISGGRQTLPFTKAVATSHDTTITFFPMNESDSFSMSTFLGADMPIPAQVFKDGYDFSGWWTTADESGVLVYDKMLVPQCKCVSAVDNVHLYAHWAAATLYINGVAISAQSGEGWTYAGNVVTLTGGAASYIISGEVNDTCLFAAGDVNVTLSNVLIANNSLARSPLECGGANVTVTLEGTNTLTGVSEGVPAIRVPSGSSLTVDALSSTDTLYADGGPNAPAIGTAAGEAVGDITLARGVVEAWAAYMAPGIGSLSDTLGGVFVVSGATVVAVGDRTDDIKGVSGVKVLGGGLQLADSKVALTVSNATEAVGCVVVDGLSANEVVTVASGDPVVPAGEVVADGTGSIYIWMPQGEHYFSVADGSKKLRLKADAVVGETKHAEEGLIGVYVNGVPVDDCSGEGWTFESNVVRLAKRGISYSLSGTNTNGYVSFLVEADGAAVTLSDIAMDSATRQVAPVSIGEGVSAVVNLSGDNRLKGGPRFPALFVPIGSTVSIAGGGSLAAVGGEGGAGIGGAYESGSGTIRIVGGRISAAGGDDAAGIGGGCKGNAGSVYIAGGTVVPLPNADGSSVGRGGLGSGGEVHFLGGSIATTKSNMRSTPMGVSGGYVYRLEMSVDGADANTPVSVVCSADYGTRGIYPDSDGKIYLWLPAGTHRLVVNGRIMVADVTQWGADVVDAERVGVCVKSGNGELVDVAFGTGNGWSFDGHQIQLKSSGTEYLVTGTNTLGGVSLVVSGWGASVTMSNLVLSTTNSSVFALSSDASVEVLLAGENKLVSGGRHPGMCVEGGCELMIDGEGSLDVSGDLFSAGIGGHEKASVGIITIKGGTIVATGGSNAAGIGGGCMSAGGTINIHGGNVTAKTGHYYGAGIGGGEDGAGGIITITGGVVSAKGGQSAAGIGGGYLGASGTITISGGVVTAYGNYRSPAIGAGDSGNCGEIRITGGTVFPVIGTYGAMGNGQGGSGGTVVISGGSVDADVSAIHPAASNELSKAVYRLKVQVQDAAPNTFVAVRREGQSEPEMLYTDDSGCIHLWVPEGATRYAINGRSVRAIASSSGDTYLAYDDPLGVFVKSGDGEFADVFLLGGDGWFYADGILRLYSAGTRYVLTGTNTAAAVDVRVEASGSTVVMSNLVLDASSTDGKSVFSLTNEVSATVVLEGESTLGGGSCAAGLGVPAGCRVVIDGEGSLKATGGMSAAGIGSGNAKKFGTIAICGGRVSATGGYSAAGIGTGYGGGGDAILISGGVVSASAGGSGASCIGTCEDGSSVRVVISGGTVFPSTASGTYDIASDWDSVSDDLRRKPVFSGGSIRTTYRDVPSYTVNAAGYLTSCVEVEVEDADVDTPVSLEFADDYGTRDVYPDESGKIYLWLTGGDHVFAVNGVYYSAHVSYPNSSVNKLLGSDVGVFVGSGDDKPVDLMFRSGKGWNYDGTNLFLTAADTQYRVFGTNTAGAVNIVVSGSGSAVAMSNLVLSAVAAFSLTNGASATVRLIGENSLSSGNGAAGMRVPAGCSLVIEGEGSLVATGGSGAAGIGGGTDEAVGSIQINGGTVVPVAGTGAMALGAGKGGSPGALVIDGGSVNATTNSVSPAATNSAASAVYPVALHLENAAAGRSVVVSGLDGYGSEGIIPDADGNIYLWLAEGTWRFTVDDKAYEVTVEGGSGGAKEIGLGVFVKASGGEFVDVGCLSGDGWNFDGANLNFMSAAEYVVRGTNTSGKVALNVAKSGSGCTVVVSNLCLTAPASRPVPSFCATNRVTATIVLEGSNTFRGGTGCAAVMVSAGSRVVFDGGGRLSAEGGYGAAGIGGGAGRAAGEVVLSGGRVVSAGGWNGAGVGGGRGAAAGSVVIDGGTLVALAGYGAHDVGRGADGADGAVAIRGGSVKTESDDVVPSPTNRLGAVVYPVPFKVPDADEEVSVTVAHVSGYGTSHVYPNSEGVIFIWLPKGTQTFAVNDRLYAVKVPYDGSPIREIMPTGVKVKCGDDDFADAAIGGGATWSFSDGVLTLFESAGEFTLSGTNTDGSVCVNIAGADSTVTLADLVVGSPSAGGIPPIRVADGISATIGLSGENAAIGGYGCAAICVPYGASLVLEGSGHLLAVGGDYAAAIGGNAQDASGSITVRGGRISALGGVYGAAMGGGYQGVAGAVAIDGGTVTLKGGDGSYAAANGHGGGYGSLAFTGGSIWASSADLSPQPTNAHAAVVYPLKWKVENADPARAVTVMTPTGYGTTDIYPDCDGMICIWLPEGTQSIGIDGVVYTGTMPCTQDGFTKANVNVFVKSGDSAFVDIAIGAGDGWTYDGTNLVLSASGGQYVLHGTNSSDRLVCVNVTGSDSTVTLSNLCCDAQNQTSSSYTIPAFSITNGISATVLLVGENSLVSPKLSAGLSVNADATVTVDGDGSLLAKGGMNGAGIGGDVNRDNGVINIAGGHVTAEGGGGAAGIGSGIYSRGSLIHIYGGVVRASGAGFAAGIGGGSTSEGSTVLISGGTIASAKGFHAIGCGYAGGYIDTSQTVTITGGSVAVDVSDFSVRPVNDSDAPLCPVKVAIPDFDTNVAVRVVVDGGYGTNDIYPDAEGYIHLWLTAGMHALAVDDKSYRGTVTLVNDTLEEWSTDLFIQANYGEFVNAGRVRGEGWEYNGERLMFNTRNARYVATGSDYTGVSLLAVTTGVTVVMSNLTMNSSSCRTNACFEVPAGVSVSMGLYGTNVLSNTLCPAVEAGPGSMLNIGGRGSLAAQGGDGCAAIGGSASNACGKIEIMGAIIRATGGYGGAGIGCGKDAADGLVNIIGGTIYPVAGEGASAIGDGMPVTSFTTSCTNRFEGGAIYTTTNLVSGTASNEYATAKFKVAVPLDLPIGIPNCKVSSMVCHPSINYGVWDMYTNSDGILRIWPPSLGGGAVVINLTMADGSVHSFCYKIEDSGKTKATDFVMVNGSAVIGGAQSSGAGWSYTTNNCVLSITGDAKVYGVSTNGQIRVVIPKDGASSITLSGLAIATAAKSTPAFIVSNDVSIALSDSVTNTLSAAGQYAAGLLVSSNATITISGTNGILVATGGKNAAGIGSAAGWPAPGKIVIESGFIVGTGGEKAAGIGGGLSSILDKEGNIEIKGGIVTGYGGKYAAGIGAGYVQKQIVDGAVKISGGTVLAYKGGSSQSDLVMSGANAISVTGGSKALVITGGSVHGGNLQVKPDPVDETGTNLTYTLVTGLTPLQDVLFAASDNFPANYNLDGIVADATGSVCLWLPKGIEDVALSVNGEWFAISSSSNSTVAAGTGSSSPAALLTSITIDDAVVSDDTVSLLVTATPATWVSRFGSKLSVKATETLPFDAGARMLDRSDFTITPNADGTVIFDIIRSPSNSQMFYKVLPQE